MPAPLRIDTVVKSVWKLKLLKTRIQADCKGNILYLRGYSLSKRFHEVNFGYCCTLAASIQFTFYERTFYFHCIQPQDLIPSPFGVGQRTHTY